jgi:hypothetical protein
MMIPGRAPSTPASQDPAEESSPFRTALVASPRYQTLPLRSWAYQSKVSSTRAPSRVSVSRTTVALIPMTVRVWSVTTTSLRSPSPAW